MQRIKLAVSALPLTFVLGACGAEPYAFIEAEDVRMEPAEEYTMRADGEYGDVYVIALQGAHEVNGWVGEAVEGAGQAIQLLNRLPGRKDGEWRVYGPYRDFQNRNLSWLVKMSGDEVESRFEAYVGTSGSTGESQMDRFLAGEILVEDSRREGNFSVDFDAMELHPEMKSGPNVDRIYTGSVDISFVRDLDTEFKHVDLDFTNFTVTAEYPVPEYFAAENYAFHREAEGHGDFDVQIASTFQTLIWSGPEVENMRIQMAWEADGSGRAMGEMRETEEGGDLTHGDMVIEECFGPSGFLTWRWMSDAYAELFPEYLMGDEGTCVLRLEE